MSNREPPICTMCSRDGDSTQASKLVTESVEVNLIVETHTRSASGPLCESHVGERLRRASARPELSIEVSELSGGVV